MRAILSFSVCAVAIAALSVACGNNADQPPPATPATPTAAQEAKGAAAGSPHEGHGEHAGGGHEDHGTMKPALHDFHETLAPIWHTTAGTERVTKACSGEKDLRAKATAVGDAELTAATDAVKAACETPAKTDVESKLSAVHDRFHKLAEAK